MTKLKKVWDNHYAEYVYQLELDDKWETYEGDEEWAKRIAEHYDIPMPTE